MKNKLMLRLSIPLILLFIFTTVSIIFIFQLVDKKYNNANQQQLYQHIAAQIIQGNSDLKQGITQGKKLQEKLLALSQKHPAYDVYVLNNKGKIIVNSLSRIETKISHINLQPIIQFLTKKPYPIYAQDPRHPEQERVFSAAKIYSPEHKIKGYLYVVLEGSEAIFSTKVSNITTDFVKISIFLIIMLLFALLMTLYFFSQITKPILNLSNQMVAFKSSKFKEFKFHRSKKKLRTNEIKNLEDCFQDMAHHVIKQIDQIKSTNELRKELFSHISHDLKTPLASLKGYLETWLININGEGAEYIQTALDNANQLQRLVEQILEASALQNNKVLVKKEPVVIAELIQDILNTFSKQTNKCMKFTLTPKDSSIQVLADIRAIERVFTNLIDNAIRHSEENSEIIVQLHKHDALLRVEIIDNGCGIPENEIENVFNPNYRASNSAKSGSINVGLGLAIVKRLLELQGVEIKVSSKLHEGTTFYFDLMLLA